MDHHPERPIVEAIASAMQAQFGEARDVAIVLGSGLAPVVERMKVETRTSTINLGLPQSTVVGHAGEVVVGTLNGVRVVALSGRVHLYEGHEPAVIVRGVRALHAWGVKQMLLTCSAGGITEGLNPGDLVLLNDHINLQGTNPLVGPAYGTRFPDMTGVYRSPMAGRLRQAAEELRIQLHHGVYAVMRGPAYETPAEIQMAKIIGADMVGMSTVPEVLAAAEIGFSVASVAVISNRAAGLSDEALSHDDVTKVAGGAAVQFADLLERALTL